MFVRPSLVEMLRVAGRRLKRHSQRLEHGGQRGRSRTDACSQSSRERSSRRAAGLAIPTCRTPGASRSARHRVDSPAVARQAENQGHLRSHETGCHGRHRHRPLWRAPVTVPERDRRTDSAPATARDHEGYELSREERRQMIELLRADLGMTAGTRRASSAEVPAPAFDRLENELRPCRRRRAIGHQRPAGA